MLDDHAEELAADLALWSVGELTTVEVIRMACDALVSGLDSQSLRELAGASERTSEYEIEDLLERVAVDFGLEFYARDSLEGRLAASRVLARECVAGRLEPREFARWMHTRIRHGYEDVGIETLVSKDDKYDVRELMGNPVDDIDRQVLNAAERLLGST